MHDNTRVYNFWNGKNINGKSYAGVPDLITERRNAPPEWPYAVSSDTVSTNDLQEGITYDD